MNIHPPPEINALVTALATAYQKSNVPSLNIHAIYLKDKSSAYYLQVSSVRR